MLHSSSFHFGKSKNMPRDYHAHALAGRHRFRDVPHIKLTDIFKSLRRRRLRRDVSQRSPLTHSRSFPLPLADHDSSPVHHPLPDVSASSLHYRSHAASILSASDEDCSSGMSTSSSGLETTLRHHVSPRLPTFPTSPSVFQLRSTSTRDYLVDRLEQHLRHLSLGDASPDHVQVPQNPSSRDIAMDMSLPRTIDKETSSRRAPGSSSHDQNLVPVILITSVDAKHAKPLPPSPQRSSRTPFGPSNATNHPTNVPVTKPKQKALHDDPFTTQPPVVTYPPDYNLTFQLPSFPSAFPTPSKYAPETPTPMCCDHFGDCRGDLWEVLHPPLVAGTFTLPPFKLPPLRTGLFDDMSMPLPY